MKGYEIIREIANKELEEGTRIHDDYNIYILKKNELVDELILYKEGDNTTPDYSYFADNDNEFEIIEEDKTIEELQFDSEEKYITTITGTTNKMRNIDVTLATKINELVKEIKKLKEN